MCRPRGVPLGIFLCLLGSYAYFWHSRDWNSASRLMLTYALVDRGSVVIDGLEKQTGDKAFVAGHYYSDKGPGFSLLAAVPYALARSALGLPHHPLNRAGFAYWQADYWVTLGTSGLLTALTGVMLARLARDLGCGPRRSALVALSYGLATPAYAYATMSYGHQAAAFALLGSFSLLWRTGRAHRRPDLPMLAAGFLAAAAPVVEISVGLIAAILGFYLLAQVIRRRRPIAALGAFAVGALVPTLVLLGYNQIAFGSLLEMGYFHHATKPFAEVHNRENPLGLTAPDWSKAVPLLWGGYRGLLFYAPVTAASLPGWLVLARKRLWGMAAVSGLSVAAVFLVNLSYPEWTGGWSTGPRLLVPLLPSAMLPVAALLAVGGRAATVTVLLLAFAGGILNLLFQGVGARIPQFVGDPLRSTVWPLWTGAPLPGWWTGESRFSRNLCAEAIPGLVRPLPASWQWLQFLPLVVYQAVAIAAICKCAGDSGMVKNANSTSREHAKTLFVQRIVRPPYGVWGLVALAFLAFALSAVTFARWRRTSAPVKLTVASGVAEGQRSETLASFVLLAAPHGLILRPVASAGSAEALEQVDAGAVDLAAIQGGIDFSGYANVRQVTSLQVLPLHLLVKEEIADDVTAHLRALRGKVVNLGAGEATVTYWLAREVLAFAGLELKGTGEREPGDYRAATLTPLQLAAEADRDKLPDAIFLAAPLPSPLVRRLVIGRRYRLVPLLFRDAFTLGAMADPVRPQAAPNGPEQEPSRPLSRPAHQRPVILREHVVDTVIPAFTYQADPAVPPAPLHTLGVKAILIANHRVAPDVVARVLDVLIATRYAKLTQPPLDIHRLEEIPEVPWHEGSVAYLERSKPVLTGESVSEVVNLLSIAGPVFGGLLFLWQSYRQRSRYRSEQSFEAYIAKVTALEQAALEREQAAGGALDQAELARLWQALGQLKAEAVGKFVRGEMSGEAMLTGFLAHVNDARSHLAHLLEHSRGSPDESPAAIQEQAT